MRDRFNIAIVSCPVCTEKHNASLISVDQHPLPIAQASGTSRVPSVNRAWNRNWGCLVFLMGMQIVLSAKP